MMLNQYGEFFESVVVKPKGLPTIGEPRPALHLKTGLVGEWDALQPGSALGTFRATTGAMFTSNRGEFRFEGQRLSSDDEIEIALLEIPSFLGVGKDAFQQLSIRSPKSRNETMRLHGPRPDESVTED